jgi:hypothetical protein
VKSNAKLYIMELEKYEQLKSAGAGPDEIVQAAKQDGLRGVEINRLLRSLFGLSLKESGALVRKVGMEIYEERTRSPSAPTSKAHEFRRVFDATLEAAARAAEHDLGYPVPRHFKIRLSRVTGADSLVDIETAFDKLYLGDEEFFAMIDVFIRALRDDFLELEMRVTGHESVPFERTWNRPPGAGPFKFMNVSEESLNIIAETYLELLSDT